MKKLMFVAAVAAAMTGLADVTSANIVGYAESGLRDGKRGVGVQFLPMTESGKVDLTDLKVVGYTGQSLQEVKVQILDKNGMGGVTYSWFDDGEDICWIAQGMPVAPNKMTFDPGDGLWVDSPNDDYKILSNGEVLTAAGGIAVTLRDGKKMVNNMTPVDVDITDITVTGYTGQSLQEVKVQILDKNGMGGVTYSWYDDDEDICWIAQGMPVAPNKLKVKPGESMWVDSPNADYQIVIPEVSVK